MDYGRLLQNKSALLVRCFGADDRHGRDVVVVAARATFAVSPLGVASVAEPRALRVHDEAVSSTVLPAGYTQGRVASVRLPSDLVDDKPGTDVLLVGHARPAHAGDRETLVRLRVETGQRTIGRTVRATGPRTWRRTSLGVDLGPPGPMGPTPLVYELAWGGEDRSLEDEPLVDERNPAGRGVARDRRRLDGVPAPLLDDPEGPIDGATAPAGFGPIAADWSPRRERAGTYDAAWRRDRAPLRPRDFDPRHNSVAPDALWSPTPLVGDEPTEVIGCRSEGAWRFRLPRIVPAFAALVRGELEPLTSHLDTFVIDADDGVVELTWRASVPLPKRTEHLGAIYAWIEQGA